MAGIGPGDVDVALLYDHFSPMVIMQLEDYGFCPIGEGGPFVASGATGPDGVIPTNTSGGLVSKGHPVGATGIAQAIEVFEQLRGEAGERQVKDADVGLIQNMGGSGASAVVHLLRRV